MLALWIVVSLNGKEKRDPGGKIATIDLNESWQELHNNKTGRRRHFPCPHDVIARTLTVNNSSTVVIAIRQPRVDSILSFGCH